MQNLITITPEVFIEGVARGSITISDRFGECSQACCVWWYQGRQKIDRQVVEQVMQKLGLNQPTVSDLKEIARRMHQVAA